MLQKVTLIYYIDVIMSTEQAKQEVALVPKAMVRYIAKVMGNKPYDFQGSSISERFLGV